MVEVFDVLSKTVNPVVDTTTMYMYLGSVFILILKACDRMGIWLDNSLNFALVQDLFPEKTTSF